MSAYRPKYQQQKNINMSDHSSLQSLFWLERKSFYIFYELRMPCIGYLSSSKILFRLLQFFLLPIVLFRYSWKDDQQSLSQSFQVFMSLYSYYSRRQLLPMVFLSNWGLRIWKLSTIFSSFFLSFFSQLSWAVSCLIQPSISNRLSFIFIYFFLHLLISLSWQQFFSLSSLIFICDCSSLATILKQSLQPEFIFTVSLNFSMPWYLALLFSGIYASSSRQLVRLLKKDYWPCSDQFLNEFIIIFLVQLASKGFLDAEVHFFSGMLPFLGVICCCRKALSAAYFPLQRVSLSYRGLSFLYRSKDELSIMYSALDFLLKCTLSSSLGYSIYRSFLLTRLLIYEVVSEGICSNIYQQKFPVEFLFPFLCYSATESLPD